MAPVYLLLGDQALLREEFLSRLLSVLLPPELQAFNLDVLSGSEARGADLAVRCRTLPVLSARRVIVVKEVDRLRTEAGEAMLTYLDAPSPTTCLICVAHELDTRSRLVQRIDRVGKILRFTLPRQPDECRRWCQQWIRERAKRHGKTLNPDAELLLFSLQGPDLLRLGHEVDKLCLFVGDEQNIELDAVEAVVGEGRMREIFELTGAVSRRDREGALFCLRRLLELGEEPLGILGMVARQVRLVLRAKELLAEDRPQGEISRMIGVPPRFLPEILEGAKGSSLPRLEQGLSRLLDLDRELKSGGRRQPLHVELAIVDLCS
ncbi:MAG: DNA polymerase III subunit delta [Candidatus Methylomirabilales bacterium]